MEKKTTTRLRVGWDETCMKVKSETGAKVSRENEDESLRSLVSESFPRERERERERERRLKVELKRKERTRTDRRPKVISVWARVVRLQKQLGNFISSNYQRNELHGRADVKAYKHKPSYSIIIKQTSRFIKYHGERNQFSQIGIDHECNECDLKN